MQNQRRRFLLRGKQHRHTEPGKRSTSPTWADAALLRGRPEKQFLKRYTAAQEAFFLARHFRPGTMTMHAMMPGPCDLHRPQQLGKMGPDIQQIDEQHEQFIVAPARQRRARPARARRFFPEPRANSVLADRRAARGRPLDAPRESAAGAVRQNASSSRRWAKPPGPRWCRSARIAASCLRQRYFRRSWGDSLRWMPTSRL